jgi:hypothetical protein
MVENTGPGVEAGTQIFDKIPGRAFRTKFQVGSPF